MSDAPELIRAASNLSFASSGPLGVPRAVSEEDVHAWSSDGHKWHEADTIKKLKSPVSRLKKLFLTLYFLNILLTCAYGYLVRRWEWYDSLYFSIVTVHTVGYGDVVMRSERPFECALAILYIGFGVASLGALVGQFLTDWLAQQENRLATVRKRVRDLCMLAVLEFLLPLIVGALGYHWIEQETVERSFYWAVVTAATVGYGDVVPKTMQGKLFTVVFIPMSSALFLSAIESIAEIPLELHRREVERRLSREAFSEDLFHELAHGAEIKRLDLCQNEDYVTANEFTLYVLHVLGKLSDHDITSVQQLFRCLDVTGDRRVSRVDLERLQKGLAAPMDSSTSSASLTPTGARASEIYRQRLCAITSARQDFGITRAPNKLPISKPVLSRGSTK